MIIQLRYVPHSDPFEVLAFWVLVIIIFVVYKIFSSFKSENKKENLSHTEKENEQLKKNKDLEVAKNNSIYKEIFNKKYKTARIYHEVQYSGYYRIPIADYSNYDLNIHGYSFFIDNLKNTVGTGVMEVRKNSFQDADFKIYKLEIIDGFVIFNKNLYYEEKNNEEHFFSKYKRVYITIKENSFTNVKTGIVHNISFTPFSSSDWK